MDWLATVLTSKNFLLIAAFLVLLIFILAWFSKKGLFRFKNSVLSIGNDDNERRIIRQQIEYTKAELDGYFEMLIKRSRAKPEFNEMRCRLSKELVYDMFIEAIALNHITADDFYCRSKLIKIWGEIQKLDLSKDFTTREFKQECYRFIQKIFTHLVNIRKYYERNE